MAALDLCLRSWAALGAYVGGLEPLLGLMFSILGPLLAVLGRLGLEKVEEHDYLENVLISRAGARSAASGAVLGRSWGLCGRSWADLGSYVGSLGPLLEPMFAILGPLLAVLGRSWPLCWWSWPLLGPMLTALGGLGPKSGPNPSGSRAQGRKAAQTPTGAGPKWARAPRSIRSNRTPRCQYPFFL